MGGEAETSARLEQAERERDEALYQLGVARTELDALRLALRSKDEPEPPLYPSSAAAGAEAPLRYLAVDFLNQTLKRLVGPLHRRVRDRFGAGHGR